MNAIEIARRMAQLGETGEALRAYAVAMNGELSPRERLEAATYTLQNGGDYKIAYTALIALYRTGQYRDDVLRILTEAFYEPNIKLLKSRYERNCKALAKYPYLFRKDFPPFEELPVRFYPYDDQNGYVPFDVKTGEFRAFVNVRDTVVSRNFFADLEKPVLASDVYSQYELEYLNDNVRPSEWCGRENHIYLHYTDWAEFCAWLTVLTVKPLVESEKAVFLIGDELSEYPIDFKKRFGKDYGKFTPRPIGVREVNRLIFHAQLSTHNGGDFFNEIFDDHPNLISVSSVMMDIVEETINNVRAGMEKAKSLGVDLGDDGSLLERVSRELCSYSDVSDKDLLVGVYMTLDGYNNGGDPTSRIAPAMFFQPHFHNIVCRLEVNERGDAMLSSEQAARLRDCRWLHEFKYVKSFVPLRRPTTSYGGSVRFMQDMASDPDANKDITDPDDITIVSDVISERVLNRSYLRDPDDRLYHDAVIVRFEDAKLEPEATFRGLAAFLDIPYTESMTYCSDEGKRDPREFATNVVGFDTSTVYRTYDEYCNDDERRYVEFFLRDVYEAYGYDFQYYDGGEVDFEKVREWIDGFDTLNAIMRKSWWNFFSLLDVSSSGVAVEGETEDQTRERWMDRYLGKIVDNRLYNSKILLKGLRFVNKRGQPLRMLPLLAPDPKLMKNPRYH